MMRKLDDRERLVALAGAGLGVVIALVMLVAGLFASPPILWAGVAVVMAGFLAMMANRRARPWTGAGLFLLAFGPWGQYAIVGAPFLAAGMWIWFRGRPSAEEIEERRRARDAKIAERRAARTSARGRQAGAEAASGSGRPRPEASKRYTPPKSKSARRR